MGRKRLDKRLVTAKDRILDRIIEQDDPKELKELLSVYKVIVEVIEEERAKRRKK